MGQRTLILAVSAGLLTFAGCDFEDFGSSDRYTQDFHYSYPLKAGGRVTVENFNGSIEITGWDDNSVEVNGTKYAATPELRDAIKIDVSATGDSVYIRTVRPSERRGNMGAKYVIRVPRQVQVDRIVSSNGAIRATDVMGPARLRTSNGQVRAMNFRGNLEAQTSNGGIEVQGVEGNAILKTSNGRVHADDVRGSVDATTSNGGINANIAKTDGGHPIRLETSNGGVDLTLAAENQNEVRVSTNNAGVTVRLPSEMNANIVATTSNGSISSEFDVQTRGATSKHHLEGNIGKGGPTIEISTSNGGIRILKI